MIEVLVIIMLSYFDKIMIEVTGCVTRVRDRSEPN